ncbi:hypothetical protein QYQ99_22485 [Comamonas testosteroni]|uniref:hypothetical protein n=1 Tax=Comamonas testosteroni TaxID=285 RepID=UPI00265F930D|nr:hypothetical protein [Comamonas testosteroni]WKL15100.1 hypothetical protein QYQ99_22485 [Comamonas testosteroni]
MLQESYFNNAGFALAGGISAADTVISSAITMPEAGLIEGGGRFNLTSFARATLVNPEQRDAVEIVFIVKINEFEKTVEVLRGQEGTTALAWNEGTKLECRITAGMLNAARARSAFSPNTGALSINFGDNLRVYSYAAGAPNGQSLIANSWAIGGAPVLAQAGGDEAGFMLMCSSVEGVGNSAAVELGVAPDYESTKAYYPGSIVKSTEAPFKVFSASRAVKLGPGIPKPALGEEYWSEVSEDADGGIARVGFQDGWDDPDTWFYPSEIGFICEDYAATSTPTVSVGELNAGGAVVSKTNLVNAAPLTAIDGSHQRIVMATNIKKGVRGMIFSIDTAAAGGTFRGRFYWKGLFVCTNTAAGFPSEYGPPDEV